MPKQQVDGCVTRVFLIVVDWSESAVPNPSGVDARPQLPTHGMAGREAYLREGEVFRRACEDVPPWSGWFWTRNAEGLVWLRHPGFPLELQSSLEQQEQQQQQQQRQQQKSQPGYEARRLQQHQYSAQRACDQSLANHDPEQLMGQAPKETGTEAFLHDLEEPLLDDDDASSVSTSAGKRKTGLLVPEILFAEAYKVPVACFTVIGHDGTRKRLSSSELDTMQVPCPVSL
ncbi:Hypothetical Protein FCC1311_033602 [Hondaea fermentalgiana]|uniref:Uncharacterized protein n=1 Tax=Hondaea fermentalgiana TaxID=2315210 RepID=A0A2R5G7X1_9STRA|nr:Hypothetical Protein FCC1311_033602 [Hondaea fermentalgiana]|eukprot:GBG27137.1 Hypothetical Protein FCC1311_033602 [Hondaea fermentalgiana]